MLQHFHEGKKKVVTMIHPFYDNPHADTKTFNLGEGFSYDIPLIGQTLCMFVNDNTLQTIRASRAFFR